MSNVESGGGISEETSIDESTPADDGGRNLISEKDLGYRGDLAEKLRNAAPADRKQVLETARQSEDYWDAREGYVRGQEAKKNEEELADDGLTLVVKQAFLYHGSNIHGINEFKEAEETTVGSGLYLTSQALAAINYARVRSSSLGGDNILYETQINNVKLIDLTSDEKMRKFLPGYVKYLQDLSELLSIFLSSDGADVSQIKGFEKFPSLDPSIYLFKNRNRVLGYKRSVDGQIRVANTFMKGLDENGHNTRISPRDVMYNTSTIVRDYLEGKGYDGLKALEGGEGNNRKNHDTYLIFDPKRVKVLREQPLESGAEN